MAKKTNIVKSTKSTITLCVIAIVVLGWFLAVVGMTGNEALETQRKLQEEAQAFLEDKLYIRAVSKYTEALTYQTNLNEKLEEELLSTYRDGNMWENYYAFIRTRIEGGKASSAEYIDLGQAYIESGNYTNAIKILDQGVKDYPENTELIDMYESIRYIYSASMSNFTDVKLPSSAGMIPAFDGEKWGYLNMNGRLALSFIYDDSTCFSGKYAVVKQDGQFVLIDGNGYWNALDKNGLSEIVSINGTRIVGVKDGKHGIYSNGFVRLNEEDYDDVILNDNGMFFVKKNNMWALLSAELEPVTDYIFTDVAANARGYAYYNGYAMVSDAQGYYLINEDGRECFTERFAKAKGLEAGMAAVADANGQWGFINGSGEVVIDFQYEDAYSFSSGLGAVQLAGKWGYVNRYNTMVIANDMKYAYPFLDEYALTTNEDGYIRILKLRYYEYIK